jgi:hypothetical protein
MAKINMKWDHYLAFAVISVVVFASLVKVHFDQVHWLAIAATSLGHGVIGIYFYDLFIYKTNKILVPILIVFSVVFAVASPYFIGLAGVMYGYGPRNHFEIEQVVLSIPVANVGIWLVALVKKATELKSHITT